MSKAILHSDPMGLTMFFPWGFTIVFRFQNAFSGEFASHFIPFPWNMCQLPGIAVLDEGLYLCGVLTQEQFPQRRGFAGWKLKQMGVPTLYRISGISDG